MRPHSLLMALWLLAVDVATLHGQGPVGGIHVGGPVRASLALGVLFVEPTSA